MQKLWAAFLALIGLSSVTPADVREWEAEAAAAMAYAACLRVEAPPTPPTPDRKPDGDAGTKPPSAAAAKKPVAKPTAKPATKPVAAPPSSCPGGVCPAPSQYSVPMRRGLFRRITG